MGVGGGHVVDVPLGLSPYQTAGSTPSQCNRGRTRTRTEILSYDIRLSSRESPGRGGLTPSSPALQLRQPRRCRDGRGCRPWVLSIPADSGRHRSNRVKTREKSHCLRVLVFHNTTSRPPVLASYIIYYQLYSMAMLQPQTKLNLISDMDHSSFIFLAEVLIRLSFGKILPSLCL